MKISDIRDEEREAINREIQIHKELNHPNIVKMHAYFRDKERLYLVLDYVAGGNLYDFMKDQIFDESTIRNIFVQMLRAVDYLHQKKILHRDIKPENILIDRDGNYKLCDFGFCAHFGFDDPRQTLCGTKDYLAPEVITSDIQDDKLDIWCLGILLYEMIHKRPPFVAKNVAQLLREIKSQPIIFKSDISEDLKKVIQLCLNPDPKSRPTTKQLLDHVFFNANKQEKRRQDLAKFLSSGSENLVMNSGKKLTKHIVSQLVKSNVFEKAKIASQPRPHIEKIEKMPIKTTAEPEEDHPDITITNSSANTERLRHATHVQSFNSQSIPRRITKYSVQLDMPTQKVDSTLRTNPQSLINGSSTFAKNEHLALKMSQETKDRSVSHKEKMSQHHCGEKTIYNLEKQASIIEQISTNECNGLNNFGNSGILSDDRLEIEVIPTRANEAQLPFHPSNTSLNKYSSLRNSLQRNSTMSTIPSDGLLNRNDTKFDFLKTPMSKPRPDFTQPCILNISSAIQSQPEFAKLPKQVLEPRKYDPNDFIKTLQKDDPTTIAKPINLSYRAPMKEEPFYMSLPSNPLFHSSNFIQSTPHMNKYVSSDFPNMPQKEGQINYVARIYQREPTITRRIFVSPQPARYASPQPHMVAVNQNIGMRRCQSGQIEPNSFSTPMNFPVIPVANNYFQDDKSLRYSVIPNSQQQNLKLVKQAPILPPHVILMQTPPPHIRLPKESFSQVQKENIPMPFSFRPQVNQVACQRNTIMNANHNNLKSSVCRPLSVSVAKAQRPNEKSSMKTQNPLQFRLDGPLSRLRSQSNPVACGSRQNHLDFQTYIYKQ